MSVARGDAELLRGPVQRGARQIALRLLDQVASARERLDDDRDREALHDFRVALRRLRSWLRAFRASVEDTLSRKLERRLARLAKATGDSRDLEVHVAWVRRERRTLSPSARHGAAWLVRRLRRDKLAAAAALRAVLQRDFDDVVQRTRDALSHYDARMSGVRSFGDVAAEVLERDASECRDLLQRAANGERADVHAARIAAKRLRYLVQALQDLLPPAAAASIAELETVQDTLGELHDAQVFGSTLAALMTDVAARRRRRRGRENNPMPGLRVLSRRLHAAAGRCAGAAASLTDADAAGALAARIVALAPALRA